MRTLTAILASLHFITGASAQSIEDRGDFSMVCEMPPYTVGGVDQARRPYQLNFTAVEGEAYSHKIKLVSPREKDCEPGKVARPDGVKVTGWDRYSISLRCEVGDYLLIDRLNGTLRFGEFSTLPCELGPMIDAVSPPTKF